MGNLIRYLGNWYVGYGCYLWLVLCIMTIDYFLCFDRCVLGIVGNILSCDFSSNVLS